MHTCAPIRPPLEAPNSRLGGSVDTSAHACLRLGWKSRHSPGTRGAGTGVLVDRERGEGNHSNRRDEEQNEMSLCVRKEKLADSDLRALETERGWSGGGWAWRWRERGDVRGGKEDDSPGNLEPLPTCMPRATPGHAASPCRPIHSLAGSGGGIDAAGGAATLFQNEWAPIPLIPSHPAGTPERGSYAALGPSA